MTSVFRATTEDDVGELAPFLAKWLGRATGSPGFTRADLHWKYWTPRSDWPRPRSYVLAGSRGIEAHCGLVPGWIRDGERRIAAAHFIDWAADPLSLGSGVRVLRRVMREIDLTCAVGGTAATREILPLAGFVPLDETTFLVRPVRPWRQAVSHQRRDWKLPARFARNAAWTAASPMRAPDGWSWRQVEPADVPGPVWSFAPAPALRRERTAEMYRYLVACPFVTCRLYLIFRDGREAGCVAVTSAAGQARLVDIWLGDESGESMTAGYAVAVRAAMSDRSIAEVVAAASTVVKRAALTGLGFREYRRETVMAFPSGIVPAGRYDHQLVNDDTAFLTDGSCEYVT